MDDVVDIDLDKKDEDSRSLVDDSSFMDKDFSPDSLADSFSDKQADFLRQLSDFDPYMTSMVAEWLGYVWNPDKEKFVRDDNLIPTLNVHGARWCVNQMRTYVRSGNMLTSLNPDTYYDICCDNVDVIYLNLSTRREEFGIRTTGDVLKIANQLDHSARLILVGATGGDNYRKFFMPTMGRHEDATLHREENKGGMFGMMKNLFGGNK